MAGFPIWIECRSAGGFSSTKFGKSAKAALFNNCEWRRVSCALIKSGRFIVQKQIEALCVEQLTKDFECRIAEQQKQDEALTAGAESERTN